MTDQCQCSKCEYATHDYPGTDRILWCRYWEHSTKEDTYCTNFLDIKDRDTDR